MTKNRAISLAVVLLLVGVIYFALSDRDDATIDDPSEPETPPAPAAYTIRWHNGELSFQDHTESHDQLVTTTISDLLRHSINGNASVASDRIEVRAVIDDDALWQQRLESARQSLPTTLPVAANTIVVDVAKDSAALCAAAFPAVQIGPINFAESTVEFRNSAYPQMERLAAFARSCPDIDILITGHTDSTGNPDWNQTLSELRAAAVGDYVATRGVDPARLIIAGAGASEPLVDNATRYGRSKNRRIEIDFRITPTQSGQ